MPDTITLIAVIVASVVASSIVYFAMRKNLPPAASQDLAEGVAYVKDILRGVVTEAEVEAVATWVYRKTKTGAQFYTEAQFVSLVTLAIMRGLKGKDGLAALVAGDSALAVELTQARSAKPPLRVVTVDD